jgi:hypothetical protein
MKMINVGQYFVVYFCPNDIKGAGKTDEVPANLPCKEMQELDIEETEMYSLIKESDDDEEIKDITRQKVSELINSKDKVKAAKQLELLLTQELELPREYYFAGVKSKDGDESIALRWKYTKNRPHNKTSENVRSIMNIYDMSGEGIWVQDFDKDSMVTLPDEVDKLIHSVLDFLGAEETENPAIWSLEGSEPGKKKEEKDKEDNDEDHKSGGKDLKDNKVSDDNDDEDDDSRGDKSDDLL